MNKKIITALLLFLCIGSFFGCSSKTPNPQTDESVKTDTPSRVVTLDDIGLTYTAPKAWEKYETTNILPPRSSASVEGDIFAQIRYDFVTDKNLIKINELSPDQSMEPYVQPICEIVVVHNDKKHSNALKEKFENYAKIQEAATQGEYTYYVLSQYNGDTSFFSEAEAVSYEEINAYVPELFDSVSAYEFDPSVIGAKIDRLDHTLSFITKTLEGDDINSSVFGDYTLTMVNFGASYNYPAIDETQVLEALREKIKKEYKQVNLIQVIIDVPNHETTGNDLWETSINAKEQGGGKFITITPDETLANWIVKNLEGVPTTVFVDSTAVVTGEQIQGTKTLEEYERALKDALKAQKE